MDTSLALTNIDDWHMYTTTSIHHEAFLDIYVLGIIVLFCVFLNFGVVDCYRSLHPVFSGASP